MVSESNTIEVNTKCTCGNGDTENSVKNYFENKCPACGKEGTLQVETINNIELTSTSDNKNTSTDSNNTNEDLVLKVVCKNCGSEYCGQDGYDLAGGSRASLNSVNPDEITGDEEVSTGEEDETSYMSGWEGLCDLLKPLDGEAMMLQRGDYVVVKRIDMPQSASLWAYEGINVVDDSVSITDYTPEIYNTFVIQWGQSFENELEFVFKKHKDLFGERKTVIQAKKVQAVSDESSEEGEEDSGSWSITDLLFNSESDDKSSNKSVKDLSKNVDTDNIDTENIDVNNVDLDDSNSDDSESNTEEVPITTKEEAKRFGLAQVGKAKREDGHTIELKVIGNHNWMMGEWCHVRLPSFNEDSYMFISKCSFESSADSEYITSLTLVDYPPSLGKDEGEGESEEGTDSNSMNSLGGGEERNTDDTGDETNDNTTGGNTGNNANN